MLGNSRAWAWDALLLWPEQGADLSAIQTPMEDCGRLPRRWREHEKAVCRGCSLSQDPELADAFAAMEGGTVANAVHAELFVKQQRPETPRRNGARILKGPKGVYAGGKGPFSRMRQWQMKPLINGTSDLRVEDADTEALFHGAFEFTRMQLVSDIARGVGESGQLPTYSFARTRKARLALLAANSWQEENHVSSCLRASSTVSAEIAYCEPAFCVFHSCLSVRTESELESTS